MGNDRRSIHLINELPHIYELEDMIDFCRKHKSLYIYGKGKNQEYLLKYFDMCGIAIEGYVVTFIKEDEPPLTYRQIPIKLVDEVMAMDQVGIILAISDCHFGKIIPLFRKNGFDDYFIMSEFNKRSIANQVKPRDKKEMAFEISLADHCNLSCQMCDHYSQVAKEWYVGLEQFEKDMIRMGELFDHQIGAITLLGGEPTLHKDIIKCIRITRREFPDGELIILTNGVLLADLEHSPEGNLWEVCKENNVHISVTVYPINLDYLAMEKKAKEYGVSIFMSSNIHAGTSLRVKKISDKHTMDLEGKVDKFYCVNCLYFNKFNVLKEGRLYMCPIAAHSDIFNQAFQQNLTLQENDSLDIYQIESWRDISEFTCQYVPFCRYCDLKHWGCHSEWKASNKKIDEYI